MRKISLLFVAVIIMLGTQTVKAQFNVNSAINSSKSAAKKSKADKKKKEEAGKEQEEQEKDYPLLSRFEGAEKVYEKTIKWDEYKLPIISGDNYLHWEDYTIIEGKAIRYQYKTSPDNNDAFVLKTYKTKLVDSGFTVIYSGDTKQIGLSSQTFDDRYNGTFGNKKLGGAFSNRGCKSHSFIVGKKSVDGKTVFAAIYIATFGDGTIITQDIFEAETIKEHKVIVSLFRGSTVGYDDKMGFDGFYVTTAVSDSGKLTTKVIEGNIHHRFCYLPEGYSVKEIITNYEEAIKSKGGKILVSSSGKEFYKEFSKKRPDHGLTNYEWIMFGRYNYYYLSAFIPGDKFDYYVLILPAQVDKKLVYSFVIIETKPMEKGFVTAENIDVDMLAKGHIAIYGIHFETGQSVIKAQSKETINTIATYLNNNPTKSFYIVGHTDNTGDFDKNKILSEERAKSVINELTAKHNVNAAQLGAYGVSSLAPVTSNMTEEGRTKNRRVEIVEQ